MNKYDWLVAGGWILFIVWVIFWLTVASDARPYDEGVSAYYDGLCFRARPYTDDG